MEWLSRNTRPTGARGRGGISCYKWQTSTTIPKITGKASRAYFRIYISTSVLRTCFRLLTHMLWDFRIERWTSILSQILEKALKCAYLTANIQDYVLLAVEILGSSVSISLDDKRRIYENLNRILKVKRLIVVVILFFPDKMFYFQ